MIVTSLAIKRPEASEQRDQGDQEKNKGRTVVRNCDFQLDC